ncbi:hypothetical protein OE88DRAFT_1623866 [Heliocybe sulcata]|uniref:N-terminal of MaoC-like dehydratase domain-containing protein n=1 Tax=Heliocybe sulcata TaxID=5364 RepID=A0A5C3NBL2_9AGAM|nr:hypothetical protein OE88DRAFT_1623866 [Heliocybe sulcata]
MDEILRQFQFRLVRRVTPSTTELIQKWSARALQEDKIIRTSETLSEDHLSDLYVTLPSRDGSGRPAQVPVVGEQLAYGHHLVFFHRRHPERALRWDGTEAEFAPPGPYPRRMWAGGTMVWKKPLRIGEKAVSTAKIASVDLKGETIDDSKVFVKQNITIRREETGEECIREERTHVYLPSGQRGSGRKQESQVPTANFRFSFTPSLTTLFRFSALTFNGHMIHLDKTYAQEREGYPERLVHAPLTALMMLEVASIYKPDARFRMFDYRAVSPLVACRRVSFTVTDDRDNSMRLWAQDDEDAVAMKGWLSYT